MYYEEQLNLLIIFKNLLRYYIECKRLFVLVRQNKTKKTSKKKKRKNRVEKYKFKKKTL